MRLRTFVIAAALVALTALAFGCGDSNIAETEVPQLALDGNTTANISLSLGNASNQPVSQQPIRFRNTGEADLEVDSIEWVSQPPRLIGADEYDGTACDYDVNAGSTFDSSSACASDTFCWAITQECRKRGFGDTPFVVPSGQIKQVDIVLLPALGEIDCPDAPSGRDVDVPGDYCGELVIKTNANNDNEGAGIKAGNLRVFFTYATGSGTIATNPASISFSGVAPGNSDSRTLTISNTADDGALNIDQVRIQDHADKFTVTGPNSTDIEAGNEEDWTIEFNAPDDWDEETIGTNLEIGSSATNERTTLIPVTASSQQDRPAIKVDPQALGFSAGNSQTLTISNEGTASLTMQSFSADGAYSFSVGGVDFDSEVPANDKVIQAGNSKEITVTYDSNAGAGVGNLEISYVYYVDGNAVPDSANVTLLGDLDDAPVGVVAPNSFLFLAKSGNSQTRSFAVRNLGTQPLDVSSATLSDTTGDFSLVGDPSGSIPAGGIKEGSVEYSGSDDQMDNVTLTLASNTAGAAIDMTVSLFAQPGTATGDLEAKITPGFAADTTVVGAEARFSSQQSTADDPSILDSASWVLLDRPAASSAFLQQNSADVSFFPDVAGTYKISVLINADSGASSQTTYSFSAE
jgi:hypothetical protein